jgi:S-formylglutathione hydrolase FrmB
MLNFNPHRKINDLNIFSMKFLFSLLLLFISSALLAATVDTVSIYSPKMNKSPKCVVIKPDNYKKKKKLYPVIYLLHGHSGDYSNWIKKVPEIKKYADEYEIMIVCPDGEYSSWYIDSPIDSTMKYETYIAKDVTAYIDEHYRTIRKPAGRAITGLSMGGHGALYLAFRHPDIFGACGSMSGVFNLTLSRNKFELSKRIGDTLNLEAWKNYSMVYIAEKPRTDSLAIIFDCGLKDVFSNSNKEMHNKLLQSGIAHDYIERPGNHNWTYWANALPYHIVFFKKFFETRLPR